MYDASVLRIDRKTSGRPTIYIPHAAVLNLWRHPAGRVEGVLGAEHFVDGLAARFLLAMPPRCAARWSEAEV